MYDNNVKQAIQTNTTDLLKTRPHFELLDGLRGVAAVVVVIFHFMEMAITDYSKNFAGHGFLAVDFFFCLSGFVIAYAYDGRVGKLGVVEFFKSRIIRLHLLVILGSILGLLSFLFDPFTTSPLAYSTGQIILIFLTSLLLIPYPVITERSFNLFGINAPAWSLFWEYVANILYGWILWKLNRRILLVLALAAAAWLFYVGYIAGNLMGGWGKDGWWHGGARVSFSFLAGMLVYRYQFIIRNRLGFLGLTILLLIGLLMPWFKQNWLVELAVVIIYFPLLVALGAGAQPGPRARAICIFSGRISYPLYMTHYAVIWMFLNYYTRYKPDNGTLALIIICAVPLLIGFAYLAMVLYDNPVRRYLTNRRKLNKAG
ncbi:acyltransferase [Chitinophaga agrisoli]|uniref:Acyltransferase n=1 Tax=Chitinophaga agrisoli TaxID=2607653 RepID=A0A5B2VWN4_9BACT|nr:acyltransferase [Chitinophaga agrisoli]KAA2242722.1 acyltransferase [Chitinophaga agrisoli]